MYAFFVAILLQAHSNTFLSTNSGALVHIYFDLGRSPFGLIPRSLLRKTGGVGDLFPHHTKRFQSAIFDTHELAPGFFIYFLYHLYFQPSRTPQEEGQHNQDILPACFAHFYYMLNAIQQFNSLPIFSVFIIWIPFPVNRNKSYFRNLCYFDATFGTSPICSAL
jgi:hypothetical protein